MTPLILAEWSVAFLIFTFCACVSFMLVRAFVKTARKKDQ